MLITFQSETTYGTPLFFGFEVPQWMPVELAHIVARRLAINAWGMTEPFPWLAIQEWANFDQGAHSGASQQLMACHSVSK